MVYNKKEGKVDEKILTGSCFGRIRGRNSTHSTKGGKKRLKGTIEVDNYDVGGSCLLTARFDNHASLSTTKGKRKGEVRLGSVRREKKKIGLFRGRGRIGGGLSVRYS